LLLDLLSFKPKETPSDLTTSQHAVNQPVPCQNQPKYLPAMELVSNKQVKSNIQRCAGLLAE
jgi:hypothetical protein